MRSTHPLLLIVEDDRNTREGLRKYLYDNGYDVAAVADAEEALQYVRAKSPEIVLTDLRLPKMDGMELLKRLKAIDPSIIVILLTAYGTVDTAVAAMKAGAYDYLNKPVNLEELEQLIERASNLRDVTEENKELKNTLREETYEAGQLIYRSAKMREVIETTQRVAPTSATVLLQGESGTGKELLARLIHELSPRKDQAFVAVHCAALTETLLASELFGHEKGAFTGAVERKIGRFERAHKGTLFLDEIGEIPEQMQVKLLRVLQDGEFERVGGTATIKADIRLISATNKNLAEEVKNGRFREDLFYRVNVVAIELPPLRERREDISILVEHFVSVFSKRYAKKIERIDPQAMATLTQYSWPGNVRELRNIVERMVVLSQKKVLELEDIPQDLRTAESKYVGPAAQILQSGFNLQQAEKELIRRHLSESSGNKSKAAKALGISRRTLYRKLRGYGLSANS